MLFVTGQEVTQKNNKAFQGFKDVDLYIGSFFEKSDPGDGPNIRPSIVKVKLTHPETEEEITIKIHRHLLTTPPPPPTNEDIKDKYTVKGFVIPEELDWCWYGKWIIQIQAGNALNAPAWVLEPIPGSGETTEDVLPNVAPSQDEKTYCLSCDNISSKPIAKLPKDCAIVKEHKYYMLFKSTRDWDDLRELMVDVGTVGVWNEKREAEDAAEHKSSTEASISSATVVAEEEGKEDVRIKLGNVEPGTKEDA